MKTIKASQAIWCYRGVLLQVLNAVQDDTKLVSILYRTHKSLSPAHKINSLYAFDALSRAARSQVSKHNLVGDLNTEPGNCATFLLKIEGVLDGLIRDMVTTKHAEAKVSSRSFVFTDADITRGLRRWHSGLPRPMRPATRHRATEWPPSIAGPLTSCDV